MEDAGGEGGERMKEGREGEGKVGERMKWGEMQAKVCSLG